ncbi:MAG: methionine gamma-lyase family protein [Alicyclobacillaceae bacterium]|nr:methionine gamma-lyase family protein [Alicyclobacillaceae bacterium]
MTEIMEYEWRRCAEEIDRQIAPRRREIESVALANQHKVLEAFQFFRVSDVHLRGSTGYGYNDRGRELLEEVYARVFRAEAALVRPQIISGTHALTVALFGVLRPGDVLVYATGEPYDTLQTVIGEGRSGEGTLLEWGVQYKQVNLTPDETIDLDALDRLLLAHKVRLVALQRSGGYTGRRALTVDELGEAIRLVKSRQPDAVVLVDNCYGEFTEDREPTEVGADLVAGSLIKNPGGGLAPTGGYVVGRADLVHLAACRLTAPGIGREAGPTGAEWRLFYQGLFLAPHMVSQALQCAVFGAALFERFGVPCRPRWQDPRSDLVQQFDLESPERVLAFCRAIQKASPVDSHVVPEPWDMPGYSDPVVMAAGTFVQGGSLELSADAPIRPPYRVFVQGGLTYEHGQLAYLLAAKSLQSAGLLPRL